MIMLFLLVILKGQRWSMFSRSIRECTDTEIMTEIAVMVGTAIMMDGVIGILTGIHAGIITMTGAGRSGCIDLRYGAFYN